MSNNYSVYDAAFNHFQEVYIFLFSNFSKWRLRLINFAEIQSMPRYSDGLSKFQD